MLQHLRIGVSAVAGQASGTRQFAVISATSTEATRRQLRSNSSQKLKVAWFTASWCGPCRTIAPRIEKYAETADAVTFIKIDIDHHEELADEWQVKTVPTFCLFKGGKEVDRVNGADAEGLKNALDRLA
ncbi:hypothetical protein FOZ63_029922 [Perkinsus olseni]|uniref:Thioredoxin domain-containing protein n=1 Tax=Perkinsus olseni TaxID=32597 RepID=A0A7J6SIT5_PEROL|nr:hypothetical protein FOZ63_029922 [Perkinsus olseni]KAF4740132.1 hypothetical protein FOZ62_028226 [Perkinsus olseni]